MKQRGNISTVEINENLQALQAVHTLMNEKITTTQALGTTGYGLVTGGNPQTASMQAISLLLKDTICRWLSL